MREFGSRRARVLKEGWRWLTVGDVTVNHDGKRRPVKGLERVAGAYPYYGASGIVDHVEGYLFDGLHLLVAEDGENLRTRNTPVAFLADGKFWVNNHAHIVTGNALADTRFLAYALESSNVEPFLTGSTQPKLTQGNLNRIPVLTPPLIEQLLIAAVLGSLDDKIELNRRMNETLEAMARALFRSWFVDFDPVRAKSEGRPSGLPADLDTLFPNEFEDSPLGEIPKGWRAGTVEDVADCRRRSASTSSIAHDEPYVGLEHIDKKSLALSSWGTGADVASQKSRFQAGEVLFGKLRPYFHKVCIAPVAGICSTDILVVDSREPSLRGFVILAVSEESTIDFVTASSGGTRMPRTSWSDLARVPLVIPPLEVAAAFNELVAESLEHIQNSAFENQSLAAQRDFLLPKLLSGEIEVAEAEVALA